MPALAGCRARQQRLLEAMEQSKLACAILSRPQTIGYFCGVVPDPTWPHSLIVDNRGTATLITNFEPRNDVPAEVRTYTGYTIERVFGRENAVHEMVALARDVIAAGPAGVESEWMQAAMLDAISAPAHNLTPALIAMRRRKMPDEIESMRATTRLAEAGYAVIKQRLEPGMTELAAYLAIHDAIANAAGTSVDLKGDFACGVRAIGGGGAPTGRRIERGDLCVYDLFPTFDGYMCDLCRTFVAGPASDEQLELHAHVLAAHDVAKRCIRPGLSTRAAYEEIRDFLARHRRAGASFTHHAGHGVGMDGWEQPWLNAGSDQTFVEGEVIACEPGLYAEAVQGGIRLEHNYLVTHDGPVPLDTFPMDLQ